MALCITLGARLPAAGQTRGGIFDFGVGGRALAMGGACTASCRDLTALYYNPAGLGLLEGRQVQAMRAALYGDASYDYVGYAQNFKNGFSGFRLPFIGRKDSQRKRYQGGWGGQMLRLSVSGGSGRDDVNSAAGGFTYAETGLGMGFGVRGAFLPRLSLGAAVKIHTREISGSSDKMMAADFGAQYGPFLDDRLNVGVVVRNAVSRLQGDTSDAAALELRAGASYLVIAPLLAAFDLSQTGELRVGAEVAFKSMFLRMGYSPEGMSFGTGYVWRKSLMIDMAMVNNPALGLSQRASLGWRFGARKPKKLAVAAGERFKSGVALLDAGRFAAASEELEAAYGLDTGIGSPEWRVRAERLKGLLSDLGESDLKGLKNLKEGSEAAGLLRRGVERYLAGEEADAMLLTHAAAGTAGRAPAYMAILRAMSERTMQDIRREDLLDAGAFVEERLRLCGEAIRERRHDAAVSLCRDAVAVRPGNALAWKRLGSAYFAAGRRPEALEAYGKALNLDPNDIKLRDFVKERFKE